MNTNYQQKCLRQSGIMGFWPLDEESGDAVYDLGPNGYNGISYFVPSNPVTRGFVGPDGGRCTEFDGTTIIDLVAAAPTSATSSQTEGSISVWVATPQANLSGTTMMQLVKMAADANNYIDLEFDTTAYRFEASYNGASTAVTNVAPLVYNVDGGSQRPEWHHLGMTYSATGDALIIYTDGSPSTTASSLGTWSGNYAAGLQCLGTSSSTGTGGDGATDGFTGWMSNFLWTSAILDAAEMAELAVIGP